MDEIIQTATADYIDTDLSPEMRDVDIKEEENLDKFVREGCGCKLANGEPCSSYFTTEYYRSVRSQMAELTRTELDLVVMGQIMANINCSPYTSTTKCHRKATERKQTNVTFSHLGHPVCRITFLFLHSIGVDRYKNIKASFEHNGISPRVHGNTSRLPKHSFSVETVRHVVQYILTYAEANAILLPGRIPGYKRSDVQLLPSNTTKRALWTSYQAAAVTAGQRPVRYSSFCDLWRKLVPQVLIMRPMSDLCWVCQQNSTAIMRAANLPEELKSQVHTYIHSQTT